jgi:uncharacterized protein (TIGR03000 family)
MRWPSSPLFRTAAIAAATLSLLGSAAPAAHGHWGGGHWGGGHWGGHWGGYWGPGFYRPYYGIGAFGLGLGLGYGLGYGLGGGYYAPYPYYGAYAPYYGPYGPAVYPPMVVASSAAAPSAAAPNAVSANAPTGNQPPPADNAVHLQLLVPEEAEVWFAGVKIAREGRIREFVSPPLTPGRVYNYQITVRYTNAAGKPVEDKRDIRVRANDWFSLDFTRPPPTEKPAPMPLPIP